MNNNRIVDFCEAHPCLRLLLPLIAGIIVADKGEGSSSLFLVIAIFLLGFFLVGMLASLNMCVWSKKAWYGCFTTFFFFVLGFLVCSYHWQQLKSEWPDNEFVYEGYLTDNVREKPHSLLCPVQLTARCENDSCFYEQSNILLYIPKDSLATPLQAGDRIRFYGRIHKPYNSGFPEAFDYAGYLYHQKISGSAFATCWQQLKLEQPVSLKTRALRAREQLLAYYRSCGIAGNEFAVLSALTLGYKEDLSEQVKELYSVSGASHVLALSGLHIGILCVVLATLFGCVIRSRHFLWLQRLFVILAVWMFVFLVGLPVSAVRAATMFSLLMIGSCLTRVGFPLNTLSVTAIGMLLYNPFYLFDVGFQMSFCAVASILLLQPIFKKSICLGKNKLVRYFWDITSVSLAAQIGVAPLIMFYFSRFSVYFLLTNLWVIPITFAIVCMSLPLLLVGLLPWETLRMGVGWCVHIIIKGMNAGLACIADLPGSVINGCSMSVHTLIGLYGVLLFMVCWWVTKNRKILIVTLSCVFCICVMHIYTLYPLDKPPVLHVGLSRGRPIMQYIFKDKIHTLTSDSLYCNVNHYNGLAVLGQKTVCLLDNDCWWGKTSAPVLPIDYLYICKGYKGRFTHMLSLFEVRCVLLDSSLGADHRQRLQEECAVKDIKCIDLANHGNLKINLLLQ